MASMIEDYGLIGNTRTAALVSREGSIDWFCGPRFDSDACFSALVGYDEHGRWAIRPTVRVHETKQRYRDETLILETDFIGEGGAARITDFMPLAEERCDIVRIVEGLEGESLLEMLVDVRFGYGADKPRITQEQEGWGFVAGPNAIYLRAPVEMRPEGERVSAYLQGSKPVRVGNAASGQFQLDVYGEVLACLYAGRKKGLESHEAGWGTLRSLLDFLEGAWQRPDDGIWEVRGGRRHFTHSKVMAWVAIDRAVRMIEELGVGGDNARTLLPHLRALRERIHAEVCQRGFNPRIGAFTQSYGSDALDASTLVIPHVGFLPARDGFVLRYRTEEGTDGLPGTEGAFLACSFWLADNYAFAGRITEAEELFDRLLGLCNHLGLLSEEYDPKLRRQVGNFPQAFSHLALIATANTIETVRRQGEDVSAPIRGEVTGAVHH